MLQVHYYARLEWFFSITKILLCLLYINNINNFYTTYYYYIYIIRVPFVLPSARGHPTARVSYLNAEPDIFFFFIELVIFLLFHISHRHSS